MGRVPVNPLGEPDGTADQPMSESPPVLPGFELPALELPTIDARGRVVGLAGGDVDLATHDDPELPAPVAGTVAWLVAQRAAAARAPEASPASGASATPVQSEPRPCGRSADADGQQPAIRNGAFPDVTSPGSEVAAEESAQESADGRATAEQNTVLPVAGPAQGRLHPRRDDAMAPAELSSRGPDEASRRRGGPRARLRARAEARLAVTSQALASTPVPPPRPPATVPPRPPGPPPLRHRPPIEEEPSILGLTRHSRGRLGSRLFTWFFVGVFVLILVQLIVALLNP